VTFAVHVCVQDIQPLRVLHLGGDEVPRDALNKSSVCRQLLARSAHGGGGVALRLHFMRLAVHLAARHGVRTVQVSRPHCRKNIRTFTDILWRVIRILTEPVPYTFVSINRWNNGPALHYSIDSQILAYIYGTSSVKI